MDFLEVITEICIKLCYGNCLSDVGASPKTMQLFSFFFLSVG